jgi:hypothetical protein
MANFFLAHPELENNKEDGMVDEAKEEAVVPDTIDHNRHHPVYEDPSKEEVDPMEAQHHVEVDSNC